MVYGLVSLFALSGIRFDALSQGLCIGSADRSSFQEGFGKTSDVMEVTLT